jgi:hypothetical protein
MADQIINGNSDKPDGDIALAAPLHVVFRYSDKLYGLGDVVVRHEAALLEHGAVWWGKFGRPLGAGRLATLNAQIAGHIPTNAYLARCRGGAVEAFRGQALKFAYSVGDDELAIPPWYRELGLEPYVGVWVLLDDLAPVSAEALRRLRIAKTGSLIADALQTSMSGMFLVHQHARTRVRLIATSD